MSQVKIGAFRCPSAPDEEPQEAYYLTKHTVAEIDFGTNPPTVYHSNCFFSADTVPELGLTNYFGCLGVFGPALNLSNNDDFTGMFYNRSQTRLAEIRDGQSNTIMFGESIGTIANGAFTVGFVWIGSACKPLISGLDPSTEDGVPVDTKYDAHESQFGSAHSGGIVLFAFGDGSVHGISRDIEQLVLFNLGAMADGNAISDSDF